MNVATAPILLRRTGARLAAIVGSAAAGLVLAAGAADASEDAPEEQPRFVDTVDRGFHDAVVELDALGVLQGCSSDRFCPDGEVTRAQFATMVAGAIGLAPVEDGPFEDMVGSVHEQTVNAFAAAGYTSGCRSDAFCPSDVVTREQAATMLVRSFDLAPSPETFFDDVGDTHLLNVNGLAAVGVAAGCSDSLTAFCPDRPVLRWQAALFLARVMGVEDPVFLDPFEDRLAEQQRIDAERAAEEEAAAAAAEEETRYQERLAMWERLAQCESGGRWDINTGNGFYGGLQFSLSSWRWVGGSGYPHRASKQEQIYRAEILLSRQGWNAWPACSRSFGWR